MVRSASPLPALSCSAIESAWHLVTKASWTYCVALSCEPTLRDLREYADLRDYDGLVGLDAFKAALRDLVKPKPRAHQHLEESPPPISEMPDTTGDEIPAEALRFATFLKLDPPKKKSHPSRGNIH